MAEKGSPAISESVWDHARHRTIDATKTLRFWFFDAVLGIVVAAATLLILLKWGPDSVWILAGIPAAVGIAWLLTGVLAIFVWHLFWAPYRQRDALREALQVVSETPFAFIERGPYHVSPIGAGRVYTPLSIRNQGSERATIEGLTASVSLGFRGEGTNWGTNPHAAVPSFLPYGLTGDPLERSWRVKENGLWELLGLPAVVRAGGKLVLPNVGVEIVDESKVREAYQRPEGAFLVLDVNIRSSIETVRIGYTMPVIFTDETGADLVASEPTS